MPKITKDDLSKTIFDVVKADWPQDMKRNILTKQLLWSRYRPRSYQNKDLPPDNIWFTKGAKALFLANEAEGAKSPRELHRGMIKEHAVPRTIIYEELFKIKYITPAKIDKLLADLVVIIYVTKEEDDKLNAIGLRSSMPNEWEYTEDCNPFARYETAKIKVLNWIPEKLAERYDQHGIEY